MKTLTTTSRILIAVSALIMFVAFFVPVWQILMWAPQYPEGLEMKIWLNTLSGDYKIISGLNHYIGMKHIEVDMFPEFQYLRIIVAGMAGVGLITALVNRRFLLWGYIGLIILGGIGGVYDIYRWGYDYGHNLDPNAPIIVPGMAYQPPLLGTKQLLNFTAYSGPDIGGYVFLLSGLLAIFSLIREIKLSRSVVLVPTMLALAMAFTACSVEPEPIQFGRDGCYTCKMTLMDHRFGGEVVTKKGKVYKFDDTSCMLTFLHSNQEPKANIHMELLVDFASDGKLINAHDAVLLASAKIQSPMAGNVAAFATAEAASSANALLNAEAVEWSTLKNKADKTQPYN